MATITKRSFAITAMVSRDHGHSYQYFANVSNTVENKFVPLLNNELVSLATMIIVDHTPLGDADQRVTYLVKTSMGNWRIEKSTEYMPSYLHFTNFKYPETAMHYLLDGM
jgi:hypothetical protein